MARSHKKKPRSDGRLARLDLGRALIYGDPALREIVYCYSFPSKPGRVKIGYSSRGLKRVVEQSTGFPEHPVIEFVIHHPDAKELEARFHEVFARQRADVLGREWFEISLSDAIAASPHLRRAAGRQLWRQSWRWIASGFLGMMGIVGGYGLGLAMDHAPLREVFAVLGPEHWMETASYGVNLLATGEGHLATRVTIGFGAFGLAALPWITRGRQVR